MKNLTNRNKIVLAIVGVLVIVVIAVAAFAQVGGGQLFGTTVSVTINPAGNPLILTRGQSLTLSVANGDPTCKWSLPPFLVSLESSSGASISVIGGSVGVGPVNAICNTGAGTKMVAVLPPPTPDPWASASPLDPATATLHSGDELHFFISDAGCTWSSTNTAVLLMYSNGKDRWNNALGDFRAVGLGSAQARADCLSNFDGHAFRRAAAITVVQ